MCIINYAPPGTDKTSPFWIDAVNRGLGINSQGYGFALKRANENVTIVKKGFFKVADMWDALNSLEPTTEDLLIIHGRIRTSGNVNAENCHPFIVTDAKDDIIATDVVTDCPVMFHNGSFNNYAYTGSDYSDTYHIVKQLFGNQYLATFLKEDPEEFKAVFEKITGHNRIAFITPDAKEALLFGDFHEDQGYHFSTLCYRDYSRRNQEVTPAQTGSNFREAFVGPTNEKTQGSQANQTQKETKTIFDLSHGVLDASNDLNGHIKLTYSNCREFFVRPRQTTPRMSSSKYYYVTGSDTRDKTSSIYDELKMGVACREVGSGQPKVTFVLVSSLYKEYDIFARSPYKQKYSDYALLMKELPTPTLEQVAKIVRGLSTSAVGVETLKVKPRRVGRVLKTAIIEWLVQLGYSHKLPTIYFPDVQPVPTVTTDKPVEAETVEATQDTPQIETNDLTTEDMS